MAYDVEFEDNHVRVKRVIEDKIGAFLLEVSAEIVSAAARGSRNDGGHLKGSWKAVVDEAKHEATIGSPLENALWEEFGTGEWADGTLPGHSGAWYVPVEKATGKKKPSFNGKVIVVYGKNGQAFYKTNGKKPNHTLQKAADKVKPSAERRARQIFRELNNE